MHESFVHLVPICGLVALVLHILVLWANPRRLVNQAFAGTYCFFFLWTGCIWMIFRQQSAGFDAQLPWMRVNLILAAWVPFGFWLIKEAIIRQSHRGIVRHSIPWLAVGLALSLISFLPSVFLRPAEFGAFPAGRGTAYYVYIILEVVAYLVIAGQVVSALRTARGIQRLELQLLALIFVGILLLGSIFNGLGSYFKIHSLKLAVFPMFLIGAAICAWGLCVHRIYHARQILLGILHRVLTLSLFVGAVVAIHVLLPEIFPEQERLAASALLAGAAALWADRRLHQLFDLAGTRLLARLRIDVTEIALTEPHTDQLVRLFAARLQEWTGTDTVTLHRADQPDSPESPPTFHELSALYNRDFPRARGWASPESLRRHSAASEHLQAFLHTRSLGLLIAVTGSRSHPSLFLAFARKRDDSPFTHPEIERLQNLAELIDNILTRSRLIDQAALKTRTEHLAMMSRGLAHDLKNLLTPVSSFLIHTDGRFPPESDEAEVHAAARRSVRIMSDYVREARFFADRLAPCLEPTRLRALCASASEAMRPRAQVRRIVLETRVPDDPSVTVDAILIQRLLANLLANAIDASPPSSSILLSGEVKGSRLTFTVADRGCGIAPENLSRIFEPYFTTKEFGDDVRGFGLGLTICQKIAALHEGTLSVRSELGHGSTFTVTLPAALIPAPTDSRAAPRPPVISR